MIKVPEERNTIDISPADIKSIAETAVAFTKLFILLSSSNKEYGMTNVIPEDKIKA